MTNSRRNVLLYVILIILLLILGIVFFVYLARVLDYDRRLQEIPPVVSDKQVGNANENGPFKERFNNTIHMYNISAELPLLISSSSEISFDLSLVENVSGSYGSSTETVIAQVDPKGRIIVISESLVRRLTSLNNVTGVHLDLTPGNYISLAQLADGIRISTEPIINATTLNVTMGATLNSSITCNSPIDTATCVDLTGQTCMFGHLNGNCFPENYTFQCLTVNNLTATHLNVQVTNQTAFVSETITVVSETTFNGPVMCTNSAKISNTCLPSTILCPAGPISDSCFPTNLSYDNLTVSNSLHVNMVECSNTQSMEQNCISIDNKTCSTPLDASCLPFDSIRTINNISSDMNLDFTLSAASPLSIVYAGMGTYNLNTVAEANTASNVGIGVPIFAGKVASELQFKGLLGSSHVNLVFSGSDNAIEVSMPDQVQIVPGTFTVGNLTVDSMGFVTNATNEDVLTIYTSSNVGPSGQGPFKQKVGNELQYLGVSSTSLNVSVINDDTINIDKKATGVVPGAYGTFDTTYDINATEKGVITGIEQHSSPLARRAGRYAASFFGSSTLNVGSFTTLYNNCPSCFTSGGNIFTVPEKGVYAAFVSNHKNDFGSIAIQTSLGNLPFSSGCGGSVGEFIGYFQAGQTIRIASGFFGEPDINWTIYSLF